MYNVHVYKCIENLRQRDEKEAPKIARKLPQDRYMYIKLGRT